MQNVHFATLKFLLEMNGYSPEKSVFELKSISGWILIWIPFGHKILFKIFSQQFHSIFASAHHDAQREFCDTQTFVKNDIFSPKKSVFDSNLF